LRGLKEKYEIHHGVRITDAALVATVEQLSIDGFDPVYGARPLKRLIQRNIVDLLANAIVTSKVGEGDTVTVNLDDRCDYVASKGYQAGSKHAQKGVVYAHTPRPSVHSRRYLLRLSGATRLREPPGFRIAGDEHAILCSMRLIVEKNESAFKHGISAEDI
jgi:hypothetical protein